MHDFDDITGTIFLIVPRVQLFFFRYWQVKKKCPNCDYQWSDDTLSNMFNLKKVIKN